MQLRTSPQPLQGFALRLNVSAYGGILIAIPVLFYQLWRFVTPGLKANEKRYALPFTCATALLFAAGRRHGLPHLPSRPAVS